jgi:branched-chain amino acid transport system ATP-binding protein
VALWARRDEPVSALPHGDQRKLEVALLMALEPQVYMFDEPTAGMSHDEAPVILDLIRELKKDRSKTILLVEHKMDVVRELADRIIVLTNGTLVADGKPASHCLARGAAGLYAVPEGARQPAMSEPVGTPGRAHPHRRLSHPPRRGPGVPRGEVTMLLGRNGAGKTTTLRTIMGLWQASQGSIRLARRTSRLATPAIAQLNIAYVPENMGIFADLTVKENLLLAARSASHAARMDRSRLDWIYELFPAVQKFWDHPAGKLSGGQKQMVAVARAIVEPRDLLIVDEPSKGLAPAIINNMIEAFAQLKAGGVSILLVEQNLAFAKRLGDGVAVMDNGRVVHAGRMADLAADEELQQSLLGLAL